MTAPPPSPALKVSDRKGNGIKHIPPASPLTWRFALLKLVLGSETALGVEFVPATGADMTGENDKVDPAACLQCHGKFRAEAGGTRSTAASAMT